MRNESLASMTVCREITEGVTISLVGAVTAVEAHAVGVEA